MPPSSRAPAPYPSRAHPAISRPTPPSHHAPTPRRRTQPACRRSCQPRLHLPRPPRAARPRPCNGNLKKTTTTDSESLTIDGIRVNRVTARNGKPLTPDEAQKESDHLDKEVAKAKEHREKRAAEGRETNARGDDLLTASRILELGTFSNPRRVSLNDRPTIVLDYAGDPNAKTRNDAEKAFRDLVGTVWIDEQDRVLVRAQGHFLHDFKLGGGLLLNIHQGLAFDFTATHIADNIWLPATLNAQGSARLLLLDNINGRLHLTTSDYRKFHSSSTIIETNRLIGPDGQPLPQ